MLRWNYWPYDFNYAFRTGAHLLVIADSLVESIVDWQFRKIVPYQQITKRHQFNFSLPPTARCIMGLLAY